MSDTTSDHNYSHPTPSSTSLVSTSASVTDFFAKDSFDRFGDDLCQHILSYLTISDKMNFVFVSKQWKRSLIASQESLTIDVDIDGHHLSDNVVNTSLTSVTVSRSKALRQLLLPYMKRFTDIRRLVLNGSKVVINRLILRDIAMFCTNLRTFIVNNAVIEDISDEDIQYFGQKLGSNIIRLKIDLKRPLDHQIQRLMSLLLDFTPNINSLHLPINFGSIDRLIENYSKLRLQSICLNDLFTSDEHFEQFVDVFGHRLRKIEFFYSSSSALSVEKCLRQLSRLKALQELSLHLNITTEPLDRLDRSFEELATSLKQLSRLRLEVMTSKELLESLISRQWFHTLGHFWSVKVLRFALIFEGKEEKKNFLNDFIGSVESLKRCSQLRHLFLVIKHINDQTFDDITIHLPQLQTIRLVCSNCVITDLTFKSLSELPMLRKFSIIDGSSREFRSISDEAVCHLMEFCLNIRDLEINCFSTIGNKSVEAFISRAQREPQRQLCFAFKDDLNIIDALFANDFIPANLELKKVDIQEKTFNSFLMRK